MNVFVVLGIQLVALALCVGVKVYTNHKLDEIDGFGGITEKKAIRRARSKQA